MANFLGQLERVCDLDTKIYIQLWPDDPKTVTKKIAKQHSAHGKQKGKLQPVDIFGSIYTARMATDKATQRRRWCKWQRRQRRQWRSGCPKLQAMRLHRWHSAKKFINQLSNLCWFSDMIPQSKPVESGQSLESVWWGAEGGRTATWPTSECNEVKNLINKENFTQIKSGQAKGRRKRWVRVRARQMSQWAAN